MVLIGGGAGGGGRAGIGGRIRPSCSGGAGGIGGKAQFAGSGMFTSSRRHGSGL